MDLNILILAVFFKLNSKYTSIFLKLGPGSRFFSKVRAVLADISACFFLIPSV